MLSLIVNQGLTTVEVNQMKVKDLKLREGEIYVEGSRRSNERTLALKPYQIMDLMEYTLQVRQLFLGYQKDPTSKQLFLSLPTVGKAVSESDSLQVWKRITKTVKTYQPKFINLSKYEPVLLRIGLVNTTFEKYSIWQVISM